VNAPSALYSLAGRQTKGSPLVLMGHVSSYAALAGRTINSANLGLCYWIDIATFPKCFPELM
jgi:hypothetical protein